MYMDTENLPSEYRPRLIIWQLTPPLTDPADSLPVLTLHECELIIDSISEVSKPIVVFTGPSITARTDLYNIVRYGNKHGLKTIIEVTPDDVTDDVINQFQQFGPRIFRLSIEDIIVEDSDTRFQRTTAYLQLEETIKKLRTKGFEIHLSIKVPQPDLRKLEYYLDYAFRCNAQGLYCHLRFDKSIPEIFMSDGCSQSLDEFIGKISEMKSQVPNEMYFSPQCVKYIPFSLDNNDFDFSNITHPRWIHCCLAGKSFGFIAENGKVYLCGTRCKECGDLREYNYDFHRLWSEADLFNLLRPYNRTCVQTRLLFKEQNILYDKQDEMFKEIIGV